MSRPKLSARARKLVGRNAWETHGTRERYLDLLRARHVRFMEDESRPAWGMLWSGLFLLFVLAPLCAMLWSL